MIATIGNKYEFTRIDEKEKTVKKFIATVTSVEDCGDFWYIGYEPEDIRVCRWGYKKIKKEGKYRAINYTLKAV